MAQILQRFLQIPRAYRIGTTCSGGRWMKVMKNEDTGKFGIIVGGVVAAIAVIFFLTGGELGGKKTVEGDQDLPPVTTTSR